MTHAYRKGYRGEHEVEGIFRAYGLNVDRVPNSGGLKWKGDLRGFDGFHIEVKRQERLALPKWLRQSADEAEDGNVPTVIFRQNRAAWNICLPLEAFLQLLSEAQPWRLKGALAPVENQGNGTEQEQHRSGDVVHDEGHHHAENQED